jgi:hypothetical protein
LESQYFINNDETIEGDKTWLSSQVANFFDTGIHELDYDEKQLKYVCISFLHNNIIFSLLFLLIHDWTLL